MPRKKQGLRSYHHKSRNGCMNCKRRRVKCSMQAPACTHCLRRNELCEYQSFCVDDPEPPSWSREPAGVTNRSPINTPPSISVTDSNSYTPHAGSVFPTSSYFEIANSTLTFTSPPKRCIESVISNTWVSPPEQELWSSTILHQASEYPYLQECLHSLAALIPEYLGSYVNSNLTIPSVPINAYQHHLTASALFRQSPPVMNEHNWIAVLAFGVSMVIFQFAVQQCCDDGDFDILQTIRALRNSMAVCEECHPFLVKSKFWPYLTERFCVPPKPIDAGLRAALQQLSQVIQQVIDTDHPHAEVYWHSFYKLQQWATAFHEKPRIWKHYLIWPAEVSEEYLVLIADGDEIATLMLIFWCAIMHQAPKRRFVTNWARRTVQRVVENLKSDWRDVLAWPLVALGQTELLMVGRMVMPRPLSWSEMDSLSWRRL